METLTINHRLGTWVVNIHDSYDSVPENAIEFSNGINGFQSKGHAVGYIKRVANHTPDRTSVFHIYPYTNHQSVIRWEVMISDSEGK